MEIISSSSTTAATGLSLPPTNVKSPESDQTPPTTATTARIQPTKPSPLTNGGVLKRHSPTIHKPDSIIYKECLKNHAASIGGHALDGCGEFMPAPNTTPTDPTSLKCAACGCHRNFHRREPEESPLASTTHVIEYHPHHRHHPPPPLYHHGRSSSSPSSQSPPPISSSYAPHHMLLALTDHHNHINNHTPPPSYSRNPGTCAAAGPAHNSTPGGGHNHNHQGPRKRFRTRFTPNQKERMHEFAEKVEWKMQKSNDEMVAEFCGQIGVDRGVLKVWMHNNKNTFGKRDINNSNLTTAATVVDGRGESTCNHHHHHPRHEKEEEEVDDDRNSIRLGTLNPTTTTTTNSSSIPAAEEATPANK